MRDEFKSNADDDAEPAGAACTVAMILMAGAAFYYFGLPAIAEGYAKFETAIQEFNGGMVLTRR